MKNDLESLEFPDSSINRVSRRRFFGDFGKASIVAASTIGALPLVGADNVFADDRHGDGNRHGPNSESRRRMEECFAYRRDAALAERVNPGTQPDNGDMARFSDFSGSYSKALLHDSLGVPNRDAWLSLRTAMESGRSSDFANILVGSPNGGPNSRLNGPQVALAFDLEGVDSHATVIPPAPSVASPQTAAEAVEHYWAALLRDVPFAEYGSNPMVAQAVADLNSLSYVRGASNNQLPYPVTPQNLFRGQFLRGDGNVRGPHISQFLLQPTFFGAQPLSQQYRTFLGIGAGGTDYLTNVDEYQLVQNGGDSGRPLVFDPTDRYLRCGRDLAAYTQFDVLYQAYFTAFLVLARLNAPLNPGNPYIGSRTEKAFATLGGPDAAGTIGEMATRALKAAWFHKWIKDMRMRPEEFGALVHARMTGASSMPQAATALHADVLNSAVLPIIHSRYGSFLLPQAFPEGSPTHPCYPTGHGTVGGACVTAIKFFFNGSQRLRPLLQAQGLDLVDPSADGLSLNTYDAADADAIDINGELNKLCWNVSVGHGIHAGIHFRSSTYWSILLGEQVALSVLRDRARSYNEPFTIRIRKFDGTIAVISNR